LGSGNKGAAVFAPKRTFDDGSRKMSFLVQRRGYPFFQTLSSVKAGEAFSKAAEK
jgi:hypothetical protein